MTGTTARSVVVATDRFTFCKRGVFGTIEMGNTSYIVGRRNGTRSGCGPDSVRITVTLDRDTFLALRDRAEGRAHTLSGEAAILIEKGVNVYAALAEAS